MGRVRALQPLLAAVSFTLLFTLGARRSEDRFLLPQTLFVLPYSAVALSRAVGGPAAGPRGARDAGGGVPLPALVGVASLDGTLLVDSRYEAERFLATLPTSARVEVLGTTLFLPRLPPALAVVRPGTEPVADRQAIPGVRELVDPEIDPGRVRRTSSCSPTALSVELVTAPPPPPALRPYGSTAYHDEISHRLFRRLRDGSLGYSRSLVARCDASVAARMPERPRCHRPRSLDLFAPLFAALERRPESMEGRRRRRSSKLPERVFAGVSAEGARGRRAPLSSRLFDFERRMVQTWTSRNGLPARLTTPIDLSSVTMSRIERPVACMWRTRATQSLLFFIDHNAHAGLQRGNRTRSPTER